MGKLTREELIDLANKIRDPENYSEKEISALAAEFDANVIMPGASALIFWPPEEEMKDYEGRMHEWNPTSEEVVDRALSYELNVTPMPASFTVPDTNTDE